MSLILPRGPTWAHCTSNIQTTLPTNIFDYGTNVTAGASNVDGAAATLLAALTHDCEYLTLGFANYGGSAANTSSLADLLIDPAGGTSWSELIADLLVGQSYTVTAAGGFPVEYHFPIWIPAGASVGMRIRTARATDITVGRVVAIARGGNAQPASWWCGQRVTSKGIVAASSLGTDHTPGNTSTFSSWTDFGTTLDAPCGALQFAMQGTGADTTQNASHYVFEFGVGGQRIHHPFIKATNTNEQGGWWPHGVIHHGLPSGAQLQVRGTCVGTAEVIDVAGYAVH